MRKSKILKLAILPLIPTTTISSLISLSSCGCSKKYTLTEQHLDIRNGWLYGIKLKYVLSDEIQNFTALEIPKSVKYIAPGAFVFGNASTLPPSIKNVYFERGSQCEAICAGSFYASSITKVNFSSTVKYIGEYAFANCIGLSQLNFSDYSAKDMEELVDYIEPYSFYGIAKKGSVTYNSNFSNDEKKDIDFKLYARTDIPYSFFNGREITSSKKLLNVVDGVLNGFNPQLTDDEKSVLFKNKGWNTNNDLFITEDVTSVAEKAFATYNQEEKVWESTLPEYVCGINFTLAPNCTTINANAFSGSTINRIVFPYKLAKVSKQAFDQCTELDYIDFSAIDNPDEAFESGWVHGPENNKGTFVTKQMPSGPDYDKKQIEENTKWWDIISRTCDLRLSKTEWSFLNKETTKQSLYDTDRTEHSTGLTTLTGFKNYYLSGGTLSKQGSYFVGTQMSFPAEDEFKNPYTSIGDYAFCTDQYTLESTLSSSIKRLSFTSSPSIVSVGQYAFANTSLMNVNLSPNVFSVSQYAFGATSTTSKISKLIIPSACLNIEANAFANCSALNNINMTAWSKVPEIEVEGKVKPYWAKNAFTGLPSKGKIYINYSMYLDKEKLGRLQTALSSGVMVDTNGDPIKFDDDHWVLYPQ